MNYGPFCLNGCSLSGVDLSFIFRHEEVNSGPWSYNGAKDNLHTPLLANRECRSCHIRGWIKMRLNIGNKKSLLQQHYIVVRAQRLLFNTAETGETLASRMP